MRGCQTPKIPENLIGLVLTRNYLRRKKNARFKKYEVYAVKYAERAERTRRESFIFDEAHDVIHPMDFLYGSFAMRARQFWSTLVLNRSRLLGANVQF